MGKALGLFLSPYSSMSGSPKKTHRVKFCINYEITKLKEHFYSAKLEKK